MGPMDQEDRELTTHLFAKAMAMLEDAVQLAAEGQSSRLTSADYLRLSRDLHRAIDNALDVAKSLHVIAGSSTETSPEIPESPG